MNFNLSKDTLLGDHTLGYKFSITLSLIEGMWTSMTHLTLFLLVIISLLTGFNFVLIAQKIARLHQMKGVHLVIGGSSILGMVGSGCTACGLPFLSLLGLGESIVYLPLKGLEFLYLSILLLSISLYFLIKSREPKVACAI